MHSTKLISHRSIQARLKSGTLKIIFNQRKIVIQHAWVMLQVLKSINTYKHSAKGSKLSGRHLTRVNIDIKTEKLIFWDAFKHFAILWNNHIRYSHGPSISYAHHSLWNFCIRIWNNKQTASDSTRLNVILVQKITKIISRQNLNYFNWFEYIAKAKFVPLGPGE